jgi:hypothetical protein
MATVKIKLQSAQAIEPAILPKTVALKVIPLRKACVPRIATLAFILTNG